MNRQQKHARAKLILKIAGPIVAAAGLTLTIICFADLFSSVADGKGLPDLFWFGFIGLPLLGIGIALTMFGYRKELARYIKNETVPVINEAAAEIAPAAKITATAAFFIPLTSTFPESGQPPSTTIFSIVSSILPFAANLPDKATQNFNRKEKQSGNTKLYFRTESNLYF